MILSLCFGWITILHFPLKLVMSFVITILSVMALIAQPGSSREMYIAKGSKPGKPGSEYYMWSNVIILEACILCLLVIWYHSAYIA